MQSGASGWLQLDLKHDGKRISAVDIRLDRGVDQLSKLLAGQEPESALVLIGALFSICGNAHRVAGVRALEQARRDLFDESKERRREMWVATERVRESLLRLLQDWHYPGGDETVVREGLRHAQRLLQKFQADDDTERLRDECEALREWWQAVRVDTEQQALWLAQRLRPWQGVELGPSVPVLEPCLSISLIECLEYERGSEYRRAPMLDGQCHHTGPATEAVSLNMADEVLSSSVTELIRQLDEAIGQLMTPSMSVNPELCRGSGYQGREGVGYGWAHTARGWLLHRVELSDDRVGQWQILAPTDWNFHTEGVLQRRLCGVAVEPHRAEALARELILSIDPCVGFGVTVHHA